MNQWMNLILKKQRNGSRLKREKDLKLSNKEKAYLYLITETSY